MQAVVVTVHNVLVYGQQISRLGVENKQEPVEQDQGVVVDLTQRTRLSRKPVPRMVQKALCQVSQGLVDLYLERVSDAPGVVRALPEQRPDTKRVVLERRPPEEGVEVEEVFRAAGAHERGQINLVEAVELVGCVAVV